MFIPNCGLFHLGTEQKVCEEEDMTEFTRPLRHLHQEAILHQLTNLPETRNTHRYFLWTHPSRNTQNMCAFGKPRDDKRSQTCLQLHNSSLTLYSLIIKSADTQTSNVYLKKGVMQKSEIM